MIIATTNAAEEIASEINDNLNRNFACNSSVTDSSGSRVFFIPLTSGPLLLRRDSQIYS